MAVETHTTRLTPQNALELVARYDIVADGSDNFATRYLVSDACFFAKKPLVTAAVGTFDGTLTTIRAHERGADGKPNPTYRCLFPEPPPPGAVPACAEAGILGALTGVLGSMMALEVIREIVGFGEGLVGRLADGRRARDALRDARATRGIRAIRCQARTPTITSDLVAAARVSYLLHTATVAAPFTTDHLFLSTLTSV